MPPKIVVTLVIIVALGLGAGTLLYGLMLDTSGSHHEQAFFTAVGAGVLASSLAALVTMLLGGFRDIERRDDEF